MNSLPQQGVTETQPMNSPSQQGHGHCQAVCALSGSLCTVRQSVHCQAVRATAIIEVPHVTRKFVQHACTSIYVGKCIHALSVIVML